MISNYLSELFVTFRSKAMDMIYFVAVVLVAQSQGRGPGRKNLRRILHDEADVVGCGEHLLESHHVGMAAYLPVI
jgi:predicted GNAT superfamily acetyltransferase